MTRFLCQTEPPNSLLGGLTASAASLAFWSLSFVLCQRIMRGVKVAGQERYHELSNWIVSSSHAMLATLVGLVIVAHTMNDLIHAKCNLADCYAYVVAGYFLQDSLVLLTTSKGESQVSSTLALKKFFSSSLGWHHFLILTVALPIILVFRRGRGDLFVGLLYTMEATVPFSCLKAFLNLVGMKNGVLSIINASLLTVVFFAFRILVLPLTYLFYAQQQQIGLAEAAASLPIHCHLGTAAILAFQANWFIKLCRGTKKAISAHFCPTTKDANKWS